MGGVGGGSVGGVGAGGVGGIGGAGGIGGVGVGGVAGVGGVGGVGGAGESFIRSEERLILGRIIMIPYHIRCALVAPVGLTAFKCALYGEYMAIWNYLWRAYVEFARGANRSKKTIHNYSVCFCQLCHSYSI